MCPRKQSLFYTDVIVYLRKIYPPEDGFNFKDDFDGDLFICKENFLSVVEIKSEKEVENVSTLRNGETFPALREKIHSLSLTRSPNGKYAGWLCVSVRRTRLAVDMEMG